MGTQCRLVVLETSADQAYVFDTTSRRDSLGASRLVGSLGQWTAAALARAVDGWTANDRLVDGAVAEVVASAGGVLTVLVNDLDAAHELVTDVTLTALRLAPGLDVCGVVEPFDWDQRDDAGELAAAVTRARLRLPAVRAARVRGPEARFPRLPLLAPCSATGLPASVLHDDHEAAGDREPGRDRVDRAARPPLQPRSLAAVVKTAAVGSQGGAYDQLAGLLWPEREPDEARDALAAAVHLLDRDAAWVAVVHADGNGLGQLFERLPEFVVGTGSDRYAEGLRHLSHAVEQATQDALRAAAGELAGELAAPAPVVIPLLSGGYDLTVVCDGESALPFAAGYLYAFEAATRHRLAAIPPSVLTGLPDRVSAAAGVAIAARGCPLVRAYQLAVDLTREAKAVKTFERGSSALSFHVLHDASATTLRQVRDRTTFVEPAAEGQLVRLVAQPYVVDGPGSGRALGGVAGSTAWGARHRWADLLARVDALRGADSRAGAGTQARDLRSGLFAGRTVADARFDLVRYHYDADTLDRLAPGGSLFWTDGAADGALVTGLLDALDADPFLPRPSAARAVGAGRR